MLVVRAFSYRKFIINKNLARQQKNQINYDYFSVNELLKESFLSLLSLSPSSLYLFARVLNLIHIIHQSIEIRHTQLTLGRSITKICTKNKTNTHKHIPGTTKIYR